MNKTIVFLIAITRKWILEKGGGIIDKLDVLLEIKSQNEIELHNKGVEKKGIRKEIELSGYKLAGFDLFKCEILAELNWVKYKYLQDTVYGKELTYDEIVDLLDVNYISGSTIEYSVPVGF